jgi:hypothetical protein
MVKIQTHCKNVAKSPSYAWTLGAIFNLKQKTERKKIKTD